MYKYLTLCYIFFLFNLTPFVFFKDISCSVYVGSLLADSFIGLDFNVYLFLDFCGLLFHPLCYVFYSDALLVFSGLLLLLCLWVFLLRWTWTWSVFMMKKVPKTLLGSPSPSFTSRTAIHERIERTRDSCMLARSAWLHMSSNSALVRPVRRA